jgi:hypothetical protein
VGSRLFWSAVVVIIGIVVLILVLMGPGAWWIAGDTVRDIQDAKERAAAINAVRQTLLQSMAGLGALAALVFTGRNYLLSREGQVTDRYSKAIAQLASDKTDERVGGIYALERVMEDSPRDHNTIVEVLTAFIRENATAGPAGAADNADRRTPADIQAALTVLGRRPKRSEPNAINLIRVWIPKADLRDADLRGAILCGAHLWGADLRRVELQRSHLDAADLTDARGLSWSQLDGAVGLDDTRTRLPEDLNGTRPGS